MENDPFDDLLRMLVQSLSRCLPYRKQCLIEELRLEHNKSRIAQAQLLISLYRRALDVAHLVRMVQLNALQTKNSFQKFSDHCSEQLDRIQRNVAFSQGPGWHKEGIMIVESSQRWIHDFVKGL